MKTDRAPMAVSLEGRIPFLDHRLIEFAWRAPLSAKIKNGMAKHILREVLYRYVPQELIDWPKAGFQAPLGDWLMVSYANRLTSCLISIAYEAKGFSTPLRFNQYGNDSSVVKQRSFHRSGASLWLKIGCKSRQYLSFPARRSLED